MFNHYNQQISEIITQLQIVFHGELGNVKRMLFAQHELNLVGNLLFLHNTLQTQFLPKRAAKQDQNILQ